MVVKIVLTGDFESVPLQGWIVEQADVSGVNGWSKDKLADGSVEALFAGDASNVMAMIARLTDSRSALDIGEITERPISGHEPVWLGFHHLPPV